MDLGLKGKRAAVQSASTGLGFAIAQALAAEGARVAICSSHEGRIREAAQKIPGAYPFALDLDQPGAGTEFVRKAREALGGIDILVTNAGGPPKGSFLDLTMEDWMKGYQRLWQSAVESIREVVGAMKEQGFGRILLSTSTAAKEPINHLTISNAYRAGLLGLMKSLSSEAAPYGVTVNALLPGYTKTRRMLDWSESLDELAKQVPMRRLGEPEDFGALAAFLCSKQAGYITGQSIACDGGLIRGI